MNKDSLYNKASFKSSLEKNTGKALFDRIFEIISGEIRSGNKVTVDGFGTFDIVHRKMKNTLNKKTGTEVVVPPKDKIVFTPSENLLDKKGSNE